MSRLILLRHGQSVWNQENRFTGWVDVPLAENGEKEAKAAAVAMLQENIEPETAFSSYLKRAEKTLQIVLAQMNLSQLPVFSDWRLNERHYGDLQGINKSEAKAKYGEEQVHRWRRGYEDTPPEAAGEPIIRDKRYTGVPIPRGESLKTVKKRVVACFDERIAPILTAHQTVLIVAHGNSLRALSMHLEDLSAEEIINRNIPTGIPIIYDLDKNLRAVGKQQLLGD